MKTVIARHAANQAWSRLKVRASDLEREVAGRIDDAAYQPENVATKGVPEWWLPIVGPTGTLGTAIIVRDGGAYVVVTVRDASHATQAERRDVGLSHNPFARALAAGKGKP